MEANVYFDREMSTISVNAYSRKGFVILLILLFNEETKEKCSICYSIERFF